MSFQKKKSCEENAFISFPKQQRTWFHVCCVSKITANVSANHVDNDLGEWERGKSLNLRHSKNHPADKSHNFTNWILSSSSLFAQINLFLRFATPLSHPSNAIDRYRKVRSYLLTHTQFESKQKENHSHLSSDLTSLSCQAVFEVNKTPPDGVNLSTHVLCCCCLSCLLYCALLVCFIIYARSSEPECARLKDIYSDLVKELCRSFQEGFSLSLFPLTFFLSCRPLTMFW